MKTVAVLMGGVSSERPVSLDTGKSCSTALRQAGYSVTDIDITTTDIDVITKQLSPKPDYVYNALHGTFGEDGQIQDILNTLNIPYTHSGAESSRICMDKPKTIAYYKKNGIDVVEHVRLNVETISENNIPIPRPIVIKPACDGSSVGLYILHEGDPLPDFSDWKYGDIMVEKFVRGVEYTCVVLDGKALTVTEIHPKSGTNDFEAKYTNGASRHVCPADIDEDLMAKIMKHSETAHRILGCRGISRTDFMYDPETDTLATLETNTQPGMTQTSLVPEQAITMGISLPQLVTKIIELAKVDNKHE